MPEDSPLPESATAGKCEGRLYGMKLTMAKKSVKAGKTEKAAKPGKISNRRRRVAERIEKIKFLT
jgi:hypothetical protein